MIKTPAPLRNAQIITTALRGRHHPNDVFFGIAPVQTGQDVLAKAVVEVLAVVPPGALKTRVDTREQR